MAGINRVGSPMDLIDDKFEQSKETIENKKRALEKLQRAKSPFLIGTIEEVNKKISRLDRKLQQYTQLVVESHTSDYTDKGNVDYSFRPIISNIGKEAKEKKEMEQKELNKFAGYFTLKQTLLPGRSERVKNISKISMSPSKMTQKKETGKPKFVELHQYPGYDPAELTDLPDEVPAHEMMKKAAEAQMELQKKPHYRPEFEKLFYSPMSQAVFQDIFWYLFLERYQSSKNAQVKLFNRTAFNYVKLMLYVRSPIYKDVFFKDYPLLISQAVYAAYCHCFPDSYRQFGEEFREALCALVYGWIAGIKPAPRCWLKWNMDKLEPANIKMREEILNAKSKKSTTGVNFDFLDSLFSDNISRYPSTTSLSQSNYSTHSTVGGRGRHKGRATRIKSVESRKSGGTKGASSSSSSSHETEIGLPEVPKCPSPRKIDRKPKPVDPRKLIEALTPIRETTFEDYDDSQHMSPSEQVLKMMEAAKSSRKPKIESHPACKGPDTVKSVYNIYGQSPLVAHFMRMKNVGRESGQVFLVQRTEQENLPSLDAQTYRDLMRECFHKVRQTEHQYQEMYEASLKGSVEFGKQQRQRYKDHYRRQKALLAQPNEVKRLSDLLILELRKDPDSISAGAGTALEQALMAQN